MNPDTLLPVPDYEPRDASSRRLLFVAGGLGAGLVACLALAWGVYRWHHRAEPRERGRQTSFRDSAGATTDIAADWQRLDDETRRHLQTYGWIDRPRGVVRIPIEVAMQRLVDEAGQTQGGRDAGR